MYRVILKQEAIDDLNEIWNYSLETWSQWQADKYYEAIELACIRIGQNPKIGKAYQGVRRNLLGLRSGRHIIFYEIISDEEIEVIRILHERMDLPSKLGE